MSRPAKVGQVWRIVKFRHALFEKQLGQELVLIRGTSNPEVFWCSENRPIETRINRFGHRVIKFDPRCIQTLHDLSEMEPVPDQAPLFSLFSR